jgi:hypothetical protein
MITDNLRRLAGVNAAAEGGKWEPAAEILSRVLCGEGSQRHLGSADQRDLRG